MLYISFHLPGGFVLPLSDLETRLRELSVTTGATWDAQRVLLDGGKAVVDVLRNPDSVDVIAFRFPLIGNAMAPQVVIHPSTASELSKHLVADEEGNIRTDALAEWETFWQPLVAGLPVNPVHVERESEEDFRLPLDPPPSSIS